MKVLGKKLGLEEEKLQLSEQELDKHYKMDDKFGELLGKH